MFSKHSLELLVVIVVKIVRIVKVVIILYALSSKKTANFTRSVKLQKILKDKKWKTIL